MEAVKRGKLLVFVIAIIILLCSASVFSQPTAPTTSTSPELGGENPFTENPSQSVTTSIQNNQQASGSVPANTQVSPNGISFTVSGQTETSGGAVSTEKLEIRGNNLENVEGFRATSENEWTASSASQIQSNDFLLVNAVNVRFSNGILIADHADSFIKFGAISSNANSLESTISSFSVGQADSIVAGCVNVQGIEDSSFKIYSNAVEIESNGNAMEIEDCSFNRMAFSGRKIAISKETPARYRIGNGTLNYTGERYNESLDAGNSTIAEMGAEGFSCLTIKAPGTYWYSENLIRDFGINIPSSEYRLCLRKIAGEPFPNYDGLIDFPDKKITLGKIANYLRQIFRNGKLLALRMLPAYEGHDKDSLADMKLDEGFEKIQTISLSLNRTKTDFNGKVAVLRSGNFEITEEGSARFLKIRRDIIFPDVWEFANSSIHQPNLSATNGILIQRGKNRVIAVTPGSEQQEKAEEFLENYWNRNQGETLADFLESEAYR